MKAVDITFEESPWQQLLDRLKPGSCLSALTFLPLMENEEEEEVAEAMEALDRKGVSLSLEGLPLTFGSGSGSPRLEREHKLRTLRDHEKELDEKDPLRIYLEELGQGAMPDSEQSARDFLSRIPGAEERLLTAYLPRAAELALGYTGRGVLLMDLIQEGSLGLWQGIRSYEQGDLWEHCAWWICQYMAKAVVLQTRSGELGQKLRKGMEDYREADSLLLSELGRSPTREEISARLHISPEEGETYEKMIQLAKTRLLVDQALEGQKPDREDEDQAVEDTAYFQQRQRIEELLSLLPPEEGKLLSLRFGLEGGLPLTPQETGEKLGLTAQEVVEREARALEKLRQQKNG